MDILLSLLQVHFTMRRKLSIEISAGFLDAFGSSDPAFLLPKKGAIKYARYNQFLSCRRFTAPGCGSPAFFFEWKRLFSPCRFLRYEGTGFFVFRRSVCPFKKGAVICASGESGEGAVFRPNTNNRNFKEETNEESNCNRTGRDYITLGTIGDTLFESVTDKVGKLISSKLPRNYSSFAGDVYEKNPNATRTEIYERMQRAIRTNQFISDVVSVGFDVLRNCLPY